MQAFSQAEKVAWLDKIRHLNEKMKHSFNDHDCLKFFEDFTRLRLTYLIVEIEAWLLEVLKKEDLPIIYGLLGYWYLQTDDWENSENNLLTAQEHFPNTILWKELFSRASFADFFEQNSD